MELVELIAALSKPTAYPFLAEAVEVHQTHISVVFLAGSFAYKIKKPIQLDFLDFSTLEQRRHYCEEEVRLNRRLARPVYLDVVPITQTAGGVCVEVEGEPIEWAVKMERLPEDATLLSYVRQDQANPQIVQSLARRIADFHAHAETSTHISGFGRFEVVARNIRDCLQRPDRELDVTISRTVHERLHQLVEQSLATLRPLIEARASRGMSRDTHGDLHLDHVYLFPSRPAPDDVIIVDCIEFNERFRYGDPIGDMAFLTMDLKFYGRRDLATCFADAYFNASGDTEGRALLPLYTAYRAAVRGKVEGLELSEPEIPAAEHTNAVLRARAHWLLALGELASPPTRPCLALVGGLPGTGKSHVARRLADSADFSVIRSDVVRKELAGTACSSPAAAMDGTGIYSPEWIDRTYAECLRRASELLFQGRRVIVDATFVEERHRRIFLNTATRCGVPGLLFLCEADPELVRQRLADRRGDASDADWNVYTKMSERWTPPTAKAGDTLAIVRHDAAGEQNVSAALDALREQRLLD